MSQFRLYTSSASVTPVTGPSAPRMVPPNLKPEGLNKLQDFEEMTSSLPSLEAPSTEDPKAKVNAYGVKQECAEIGPMKIMRRKLLPADVEIDLHYCGICHSDIHHVYNEWKDSIYPMVPGHEMIGIVSKVGEEVKEFKPGDKVAVGNLVDSCRKCTSCKAGTEQYCLNGGPSWVYNGHERYAKHLLPVGELTMGGYSENIVVNKDFVLKLPKKLTQRQMASLTPMLCAGITVYTPLILNGVNKKDKKMVVGVAGIGGLGHLAIKMIKAMGAIAVALTRTPWKLKDASRLGADHVILASDDSQMMKAQGTIDLILCTIPHPHNADPYLNLLKVNGKMWNLGVLEHHQSMNMKLLTNMQRSVGASNVGGISSTKDMLAFCIKHDIFSDIELTTFENVRDCFDRVRACNVQYRFVIDIKQQHVDGKFEGEEE